MIRNVPKIDVEQTKSNGEFYLYLSLLAPTFKKLFKKLAIYMWLMFIHVGLCTFMCELWVD